MAAAPSRAIFGAEFLRRLVVLAGRYWSTPEAPRSAALLAGAIVLELATVVGSFQLGEAQRGIIDALEARRVDAFFGGIAFFLAVVFAFVLTSTFRIYLRQALEIRWRRFLTGWFLGEWIAPHACCQMELHRISADNPDQRIAEDVRNFVASALGLSLSLLAALATLVSFAGLLWRLSGDWPIRIAGTEFSIPGLMLWVALVYSCAAIAITHRAGRRLIPINFDRLRFEADFRFGLVRFRERASAVALARGEDREQARARGFFAQIAQNWSELIRAQRNLTLLTTSVGQLNGVVPLLLAAPGYFAGGLSLGSVVQAGIAYAQVSGSLTWFVNAYQELAQWRASIERLFTLEDSIADTRAHLERAGVRVETAKAPVLRLRDLSLSTPYGRALIAHANAEVAQGERICVVGPSGAGQTILFRAILGHWPFGSGRIELPEGARVEFLSDRPFLPIATLREGVSYPEPETRYSDARIAEALRAVGLAEYALRLDEVDHWEKRLSSGEQQRLAFARVLLHEPAWILLDDSTGALDEETERSLYQLLAERLSASAVVSIAHRPSVSRHHERSWRLVPMDGAGSRLEEVG